MSKDEVTSAHKGWLMHWQNVLTRWHGSNLTEGCQQLYLELNKVSHGHKGQPPLTSLCPHAPDSYLPDHALLTSAIVYCLAFDENLNERDRLLLRLAALSHELPIGGTEVDAEGNLRKRISQTLLEAAAQVWIEQAWYLLDAQAALLESSAERGDSLAAFAEQRPQTGDRRLDLLWYAHMAASQPLFNRHLPLSDNFTILSVIDKRVDFERHPLTTMTEVRGRIGLVHGGATKIKDYVFESAKLPDIRGGSALLDRLNLLDTRALFGEANQRRDAVMALVDAPECVIYANGGDVLALAPVSQAQELADAVEQLYIRETLTGQCVAVSGTYSLLELQYGLNPTEFWSDDYLALLKRDDAQEKKLLRSYYGAPKNGVTDEQLFHRRKGFGELTTALALKRFWRREGNEGSWRGHPATDARVLAHFETLPFGQRCSSCDRRIASQIEDTTGDMLCEPCLRKRSIGWETRAIRKDSASVLEPITTWRPGRFTPWPEHFRDTLEHWADSNPDEPNLLSGYLRHNEGLSWPQIDSAEDLDQIGQAAIPKGFIGLIYADGNNVGALIESIRTASFYRQFASRLFEATQAAVFTALANHLHPTQVQDEQGKSRHIHPFEIVNIGGDDLFLIVPAHKALSIALDIARLVEQTFHDGCTQYRDEVVNTQRYDKTSFQADGRPHISLSAGVVLAQKNNPIFFLKEITEGLLKLAKSKAKALKKDGYTGGTIDFMALKSVTMVTSKVGEFRETALRKVNRGKLNHNYEVLHLTARPYTLYELEGLLQTVKALKKVQFPRSQLYQLRTELPKGILLSCLSYLYFTSRLSFEHSALVRQTFDRNWHDINDLAPWRRRSSSSSDQKLATAHEWETILADLIEIYDFVSIVDDEE
ncbi:MAG: hypothetical protein KJZ86_08030 [Caldilineaceae bacterium]|nr:hypothetical protein [Caldilineaceae bacterium]